MPTPPIKADTGFTTTDANGYVKTDILQKLNGDSWLAGYATTAAVAAGYQPLDSDLTAIAALTTTAFGRSILEVANAAAATTLISALPLAGGTLTGALTLNAAGIIAGAATVSATEVSYLDGVTSAIQTQFNTKIPAPGLHQSTISTYIYDNFDRADGLLNGQTCPTGQVWSLSGVGAATTTIENRSIQGPAGSYCSLPYGANIRRVAGVFWIDADGRRPSAIIASNGQSLTDMLHLNFDATGGALTKRQSGGSFVPMGITLVWDLRKDGTRYSIAMEIDYDDNTVTVIGPDGIRRTTAPDSAVSTIAPDTGIWQDYNWCAVEMGRASNAPALAALGNAGAASEIETAKGTGIAKRRQPMSFNISTVGWYRVLTAQAYYGNGIHGTLQFSGGDNTYNTSAELSVSGYANGVGPYNSGILQRAVSGNGAITQVRVTRDGSTQCAVDIYVAQAADDGVVDLTFDGIGTVIPTPVVGAVSLGTADVFTLDRNQTSLLPSLPASFSDLSVGTGGYTPNAGVAIRASGTTSGNRMAFSNLVGVGNFTGYASWGVNGVVSDTDAVEAMRLDATGLHIGTAGSASTPLHIQNAAATASRQTGLRLQSGSGGGNTMQSIEWSNGLGVAAAVDAFREGGGFVTSLRFWTMNSGGTLTNVGAFNGAGDLVLVNGITIGGDSSVADTKNISFGTTTGTKIATATTQKIGFWNATPVVQPTAVADATDAASVITQLNSLLAKLRTIGIIAT